MKSMKAKVLLVVGFLAVSYFVLQFAFKNEASKSLIEVNQQIAELNGMTPEKYYQASKEDLLKRKKNIENFLKK